MPSSMSAMPLRRLLLLLCLSIAGGPTVAAPPKEQTLTLTLVTVPEAVWTKQMGTQRLPAVTLLRVLKKIVSDQQLSPAVEVRAVLKGTDSHTETLGKTVTFAKGWESPEPGTTILQPEQEESRLVGTELNIRAMEEPEPNSPQSFEVVLKHVFAEPKTHPVNYGAAAVTDEERLKLSGHYPIFDQLNWSGIATLTGSTPTLLVNTLRQGDRGKDDGATATRCLIFLQIDAASTK